MPVRCRNFNNDGSVKQKCHSKCRFVHPDQPEWGTAAKYHPGGSRGRDFGRPQSESWGAPPPFPSSSKAGPSGVRRPSSSQILSPVGSYSSSQPSTSLTNGKLTSDQRGWGSMKPRSTSGKGKDTNWDDKESGDRRNSEASDASKGWGITEDNNDSWGVIKGGDWGASKSFGWETRDSGWGTEAIGSGWGGKGTSSWSTPDLRNSDTKPENELIQASSWETGSGWGANPKPPPPAHPPAVTKDPRKERPRISIALPAGPEPAAGPPPRDEPASGITMTPGTPLLSTKENAITSLPSATPRGITPTEASAHSAGHSSPAQIYATTMRFILQTVILQIDLDTTRANIDRWKRTQNSMQFTRATPATQVLLDNQLLEYVKEASDLKKRLDVATKRLAQLPDIRSQLPTGINGHKLAAYSTEIRNWIQALKRLESTSSSGPSKEEKPQKPKDPKESTWDQIQATLTSTDDTAESTADILRDRHPLAVDIDSKMAAIRNSHETIYRNQIATVEAYTKEALDETKGVGCDIEELAKETANLRMTVDQNQHTLTQLQTELEDTQKINSQAKSMLNQFQEWKERDDAQILELTKQLRSLHHITRSKSPISVESLVSRTQALFLDDTRCKIATLFEQIRQACSESNRGFIAEAVRQSQLVVSKTDTCHQPDRPDEATSHTSS